MVMFVSFPVALSFARDCHDSIGVNIKNDLDLRHASWSRWNANEIKFTQELVVCSHLTLPLQHTDTYFYLCLIVSSS